MIDIKSFTRLRFPRETMKRKIEKFRKQFEKDGRRGIIGKPTFQKLEKKVEINRNLKYINHVKNPIRNVILIRVKKYKVSTLMKN